MSTHLSSMSPFAHASSSICCSASKVCTGPPKDVLNFPLTQSLAASTRAQSSSSSSWSVAEVVHNDSDRLLKRGSATGRLEWFLCDMYPINFCQSIGRRGTIGSLDSLCVLVRVCFEAYSRTGCARSTCARSPSDARKADATAESLHTTATDACQFAQIRRI